MKSTKEVYAQEQKVYRLLWEVSTTLIEKAHPATGGNHLYAHNWGNAEARKVLDNHSRRSTRIFNICHLYKQAFKAEYPNHLSNK
jgi:hypothetical protein